jgi:thiamine pyrophosphate-dependent acetolactate synthase large subunit-like protein
VVLALPEDVLSAEAERPARGALAAPPRAGIDEAAIAEAVGILTGPNGR